MARREMVNPFSIPALQPFDEMGLAISNENLP
jgi:hypothetical protein